MGDYAPTPDNRSDAVDSRTDTEVPTDPVVPDVGPALQLTIVEYAEAPDRGTIHPPGLTGVDRMETWMTANMTAFVTLSDWR